MDCSWEFRSVEPREITEQEREGKVKEKVKGRVGWREDWILKEVVVVGEKVREKEM